MDARTGFRHRSPEIVYRRCATPDYDRCITGAISCQQGSAHQPDWQDTEALRGDLYFSAPVVNAVILECARAGLHPHTHTVGDGAIEMVLDAVEQMRAALPGRYRRVST